MGMVALTRRQALWGGLGLVLVGCKGKVKRGSPTEPTGGAVKKSPSPVGYSHVLRLDGAGAQAVADVGLTFVQVEPFNTDTITTLSQVRAAADVMRRTGGVLLVTVVNI